MTKSGYVGTMKFWELTRLQLACIWLRYISLPWLPILRRRFRNRKFIAPVDDPILLMSATDLAEVIRKQEKTSVVVVQAYIDRIKVVNPVVNALAGECFEDALNDALNADKLCKELGAEVVKERYPLLGVPFSVKVTIGAKGLPIHGGVYSRRDMICEEDSIVVKKLRAAGAIPICVTNVPEWGMSFESNNKIHGHTLNPYDTRRTPGGSSGGETALISSAASIFGIGSDFMGSCRQPAMFCGVFGHRPSIPLVNKEGLIPVIPDPLVQNMLAIGLMCRYANDLPVVLKAMTGSNLETINIDTPVDIKSLKVFYPVSYGNSSLEKIPVDKEILDRITSVVEDLSKAGVQTSVLPMPFDGLFDRLVAKYMLIDHHLMTRFSDIPSNGGFIREYFKWLFGKSNHCLNSIHADFVLRTYKLHMNKKTANEHRRILDEYEKELKVNFDGLQTIFTKNA